MIGQTILVSEMAQEEIYSEGTGATLGTIHFYRQRSLQRNAFKLQKD